MTSRRCHANLTWKFSHEGSFRAFPRQGKPFSVYEWVIQMMIKCIAWLPIYTAIIVTLMLLMIAFGVPFMEGG